MSKESLLSSMPKLILAVVLIVCIGAVMGLMGWALTERQTRVSKIKTPDEIVEKETDNWKTYRNEEIKYEMKYPKDWTVKENNYLHPFGEYVKNVQFFSPNEKYVLLFGIKQKDADFRLDGRTGIRAGDFVKNDRFIKISGVDVEIENLVYKEKIKEVWYKYFQIDDFVGKATFSFGNDVDSDDKLNLKNARELQIAEKILESFEFIEKEEISDWQTYRNEEFGFEVKYPKEWTAISPNMIDNLVGFGVKGGSGVAVVTVEIFSEKNIQEEINKRKLEMKAIDKDALITESEVLVNNIKAKQIKLLYQPLGSFPESFEVSTYFNYRNNFYAIHLSTYKRTEQEAIDIYNPFLSSFKFIEK